MKHILPSIAVAVFALSSASKAQNLGIWAHNGTSTYSGVLCGFSCNARIIRVSVKSSSGSANSFGVNVSGRKDQLALLLLAAGPAKDCTTGLRFAGIKNTLLANFPPVIAASGKLSGSYRGGSCGGGFATLLPTVSIPSSVQGGTVTIQAVAPDDLDGAAAFTSAIQVTFF